VTLRSKGGPLFPFRYAVEGEASFVFWIAVDPSMEALGETSCFAQSRKQMERFTRGARHSRDMRDWVLDRSTKRRGP